MSDWVGDRTKDKDVARTYTIDCTPYLTGGETVSSASWTVPNGITNDGSSNDSTSVSIRLSGGSVGTVYKIEVQVTMSNGDTPQAHFLVEVTN